MLNSVSKIFLNGRDIMSSNKFDPLANLFSTAQLSGLSGGEGKTTKDNPLGIDFEALDTMPGVPRPKTPPKPKDDVVKEGLLGIDEEAEEPPSLEEAPEAEEPVVQTEEEEQDPEIALRLALAQQALMRAKIKRDREKEVKEAAEQERIQEEEANKSQVGERLANILSNDNKSAMDLFLEAMDEGEAPKKKAKPKKKKKSKKSKPKSMKEAADAMEKTPLMANALSLSITALIQDLLPLLTEFHVASTLDSFNRSHLKVMWMTKKTQFLQSGKLEYAVAALSVMDALDTLPEGDLIAAYVETTASDYLIWVDRENNKLVAAFANASEYFG
jgi:hypothetical protein